MTERMLRGAACGLTLVALAIGCGAQVALPDRAGDGGTAANWFEKCTKDAECREEASCRCGACTITCHQDDECVSIAGVCSTPLGDAACASTYGAKRCTPVADLVPPVNPSGDCGVIADATRAGLPPPGESDVWLPDCNPALTREYWRVYRRRNGTAYMLPDVTTGYAPCNDGAPLRAVAAKYGLCDAPSAVDSSAMTPEDALALAHSFNTPGAFPGTPFQFFPASPGILPPALPGDVADACKLGDADDSPGFARICAQVKAWLENGNAPQASSDENLIYQGQGGADVAYRLNQLYGIDRKRTTLPGDPNLCGVPADSLDCSSSEERYFYNPVSAKCDARRARSCAGITDFPTREACEGSCGARASSCEACSDFEGDSRGCTPADDCSMCPVNAPQTGDACSTPQFQCNWGGGCSYRFCNCIADDAGKGAHWSCKETLC